MNAGYVVLAILASSVIADAHAGALGEAAPIDPACATLTAALARSGVLGATAAVGRADGSIIEFAVGARADTGAPIDPQARFLSGSIGKTFVAALALDLHTRGVLDLDAPVEHILGHEAWFTSLPNASRVTMRELLTHSSGWPTHVATSDFQRAISERIAQCPSCAVTPLEAIHFVAGQPALFAPGAGFAYSETNYLVAGLAIEKASGRSYYELLQERILTPLGLRDTVPSNRNAIEGLVAGRITPRTNYFGLNSASTMKDGVLLYNPALEWTGGGLAASSADLVRWARALYTGHALALPYLHELFASVPAGSAHTRYGLGVGIEGMGAQVSYGHTGSIPGYRAVMRYFPSTNTAVAVQINDDIDEDESTSGTFVAAALDAARLRAEGGSLGAFETVRCSAAPH